VQQYRRCGIDQFLFTIPHLVESEYLDVVGREIIPRIKSD
jgi:hypothetical protein